MLTIKATEIIAEQKIIKKVFKSCFNENQIKEREDLILKVLDNLLATCKEFNQPKLPYGLEYGIIDWAWPLRFRKNNNVTSNKPRTFKSFLYYSQKALHQIRGGNRKLIRDHIYPKALLREVLYTNKEGNIKKLMQKYCEICVITASENNALNDAGLKNSMPDKWDKNGGDIFDRYEKVGITPCKNNYLLEFE